MKTNKHSLIFGLSYALDIADHSKNNLSHSKSTAYLSVRIGRKLNLTEDEIKTLYDAALLHDIAVSNTYDVVQHCLDGRDMLSKLPLPDAIPAIAHYHHEVYDGTGVFELSGDEIPICAQIVSLASSFDDRFGWRGAQFDRPLFEEVCDWLEVRKKNHSEKITATFEELIKQESFLLDYFNSETKQKMHEAVAYDDDVYYGFDDVVKFALCFAEIIDQKSPFTATHSKGIAELARKLTAHLGHNEDTQNIMYTAGLLHDIGKLHVPIEILHKPGKLTPEERFEINKHTYYTRKILEQIDGFEEIAEYASNHHERLDGEGYPYRLSAEKLGQLDRVMAISDIYQALTEERPYRESLPPEKVWSIIDNLVSRNHIDKDLVERAKEVF